LPKRVYVAEGESRELRDILRSRQQLIKSVTSLMNHLRGLLRQEGIRLPAKVFRNGDVFSELKNNKDVPSHFSPILDSYEKLFATMHEQQRALNKAISDYKNNDIDLLKSFPGGGEVASKTIFAAVSTINRFGSAKQLTS
jgi:transposase